MRDSIDTADSLDKMVAQAGAITAALMGNDARKAMRPDLVSNLLWSIHDRLDDIAKAAYNAKFIDSDGLSDVSVNDDLDRLAAQAGAVTAALMGNDAHKAMRPDLVSNLLWFVQDRLFDIGKVINGAKIAN
ncbi:hypothetical protein [Shewanella xiamenensis]|uniref:hypothetical protein n=1 Tax=Shewanella xiamenensis TaxID=332186 RepID=UPI0024A70F4F|nr:hypothetical protein [Shewanella xiamenensis]MDI5837385.1 hypothetical protein [Shewanella xiamenensis]MDI5840360.1 hypothetical protein [Shewanella xiamenensis]MDI5844407.1 hypothetical protein [Shewanella xiamenensis]MDI5848003.1 hypothetical protein [Shewanella xiamenensis]MDI5852295.1 hypothetical protein [Shewanella xiamenensis]